MYRILRNVKVTHDGATARFKAGVYETLPAGVIDALAKSKLVERVVSEPVAPKGPLADLTVDELKGIAKAMEIRGYSSMKQSELVAAIEAAQGAEGQGE